MSNRDVNFNIAAQNQASRVLKNVSASFRGLRGTIGGVAASVKSLQASFAPLLGVFAAFKAFQGITNVISSSNEAFLVQERAARSATEAQKAFASELQRSIGVGDEVSLQLMRQAELLGINKDQADEAAIAALGVSKATGEGYTEALKKVNRAMNGQAEAFNELIPGLADMETQQEKLAAVNALVARGISEQKEAYSGLEGVQTRASNSLGDLMEVIGQILAPIRAVVSQGIAVFAEVMQDVLAPAADMAKQAMEQLPAILERVSKAVVAGVTIAEVAIRNLPKVAKLAATAFELGFVTIQEVAKHALTEVVPAYVQWFGRNWLDALNTTLVSSGKIFNNGIKQVIDLVALGFEVMLKQSHRFGDQFAAGVGELSRKAIGALSRSLTTMGRLFAKTWDFVRQGIRSTGTTTVSGLSRELSLITEKAAQALVVAQKDTENFSERFEEIFNRSLFDGVEFTTEPLPDILERQLTDREQNLRQTMQRIAGELGGEFNEKFQARMKMIGPAVGKVFDGLKAGLGDALTGAGAAGAGSLQGSSTRLLTRGEGDNPLDAIAKSNEAMAKDMKQVVKNTAKQQQTRPPLNVKVHAA